MRDPIYRPDYGRPWWCPRFLWNWGYNTGYYDGYEDATADCMEHP